MFNIIRRIKLALSPELIQADLSSIFSSMEERNSYQERLIALGNLMNWIRLPVQTEFHVEVAPEIYSRDVRIKFLFAFLDRHPVEAKILASLLQKVIARGSAVALYCMTGLAENNGFISELSNRITQKALPEAPSENDLSDAFRIMFSSEEDAVWIESSFKSLYPLLNHFLIKHEITLQSLRDDLKEARLILGAQLATLGTSKDIRKRLEGPQLVHSVFMKLNSALNENIKDEEILLLISECRLQLETIRKNLDSSGVSVDLIFKLEKMNSILDRMEIVIYLGKDYGENAVYILGQFIGRLIRDNIRAKGVREYIQENLHLLTRKIVERAGERGHHYIAQTPAEKKKLLVAASWAGVLTAFTALFKFLIGIPDFPLFFEGFFYFVNYALSFLIMQKWHLALSSKQPAYTASALSNTFEKFKINKKFDDVTSELKKVVRSQIITTFGNLIWVLPLCVLMDYVWFFTTGSHVMTRSESIAVINKHNPITSLTILYAFLTGIFLWLSSIVSGWVENLIVFREIPENLKTNSFLKRLFPKQQLISICDKLPATVGGISGNLTIAFLLTAPYIISKFTSIPFDIRHVTLAAGTIFYAFSGLEWSLDYWPQMITMLVSILLIGILNFFVSFYFAIRMAATARNLEKRHLKLIFKAALKRRSL